MTEQQKPLKIPLVEKAMLLTALGTVLVLLAVETIGYYVLFKDIPEFLQNYGYYIFLLIIAVVVNAVAVWHVKAFQREMPCMTGMMIGMTLGMTTGLSLGMIVGATNGMFFGGLVGLILGMAVGSWTGNCCGIMGVLEGMMAGLMGGTMGPMISLMAFNHVKYFIAVVLLAIILILLGLIYMMYKEELALGEKTPYKGYSFIPFAVVCVIVTLVVTLIMIYAPKSLLIR